ncbi:recombinase family protein [Caloramator sp. CAR-1]|uniref:recombinase family protein n=1 Tax=Caloramator sp. CAR-1 TaxID=3062777 RepID=UPI0026E3ECAE|nr:recombinase family protein [Caloramator sp. CAR-1]MDO6353572.1 recombinase family protein [Caloramator sp. CAR-1]
MKFAIYSRKSKFTEKGDSVENQVIMCKEFIEKNFKNIESILVYEDEGFSGKDINRPQFQKMLKDAKAKKFDVVVCYRLDRFSRNVADFSTTINFLLSQGIDFISIREQFDTSTPMGRAMMNIAAVFAQLERETIAERIKDNMLELAKTGRWLGGTPPLGYKSEPIIYKTEDGKNRKMYKLSIVPEEIETVKLIYDLYLEKRGFNSVATYLCKNHFKGKNGGEFSRATVEQIVINPVYCIADDKILNWFKKQGAKVCGKPNGKNGLMVYNKREGGKKDKPINEWIIAVGEHEGIIPSDVWLKCQEIIKENKEKSSPRSGTGNKFLLSGMIICGECGSGMASWSHYNKKYDYMERYYRCNLKNRASNRCTNKMLNAYKAEEYVVDYLKNINPEIILKELAIDKSLLSNTNTIKKEINNLQKQIEENEKIIKGLIRKMAILDDNVIDTIQEEIQALKQENSKLNKRIQELTTSLDETFDKEQFIKNIVDSLNNIKKFYDYVDINTKRQLIKAVVDNIVWYGDTETIEINFKGSKKELPNGKVRRRSSN